ncbi:MAG: hypothetical protein EZS28_013437 [Streblomastix strix]|uniref:FAD-binding domain-containing protein n=1 Tax=Streblomastix strix TaxID=222440 RepID=A0A5J4W8R0_9EUKA|nr:MAG: hypothetical protein EZS28_013437 [Streblomastix strix]
MQFYRGYRMKAVTYKQDAKDKFYDVIILGAGPASLSVAIQLMNSPEVKSIIILERMQKDFVLPPLKQNESSERIYADPALFTQVINDISKSYLKQLGVLKPIEDLGVVSVQNQSFISPKKIEFTIQKDVLMTTRQRILLGLYSQIANSKKVRIFWKALFQSLKFIPEEGIWTVSYTDINGSEMNRRARLVVVADGAHCDACSQLSLITSYFKPPNGFLLSSKLITEKYFPKQSSTNFNQIQTLTTSFSDGIVPGFSQYITNTQNEAKTNDLCISFTNTTAGGQPVSQLIDQIFPHSPEEKMNAKCEIRMVRMTGHIFQPYLNHLIVVGGSAALCGPEGEEMEYALQSAEIAAGAIQEAFHRKNWGMFVLSRLYGNKIQKEIKNKMKSFVMEKCHSNRYIILQTSFLIEAHTNGQEI